MLCSKVGLLRFMMNSSWMYKSDSDGFFSTMVVYRSSDTSYSSTVSCVAVNHMDYGSRGCCRRHVVYMCHKRLVHAIETCGILCPQVMVTFTNAPIKVLLHLPPCGQCGGIRGDLTCLKVDFPYCGAKFLV